MPTELLEILVNYFLNTYGEVEDQRAALLHYLPGREREVDYYIQAWRDVASTDPRLFLRMGGPELGDATLRGWLRIAYTRLHSLRGAVISDMGQENELVRDGKVVAVLPRYGVWVYNEGRGKAEVVEASSNLPELMARYGVTTAPVQMKR